MEHSKDNPKIETESGKSRRVSQTYEPGSIWEHFLFGMGAIIVMTGPFLIPGLTVKNWILGLFGSVIGIYIVLCLLGAWKSLKRDGRPQRRTER